MKIVWQLVFKKIIQKSLQIDNNQHKDNPFENKIKKDN